MKFEALEDGHIKFIWTGYKTGTFGPVFEDGLEPMDFTIAFINKANDMLAAGTEIVVARADTSHGNVPVGMFTIDSNQNIAWPHVFWLPIASNRNKLEVTAKFLQELKLTHMALILAEKEDEGWFKHLAKYGLLRRIGTLRHCPVNLEGRTLFQTVNA